MRFIVGFGVGGLAAVDLPLLQEFMRPRSGAGSAGCQSAWCRGAVVAAFFSAFLGGIIGWRGLFAIGLVPAAFAFLIRIWVPESPRWLIGRRIEARARLPGRSRWTPARSSCRRLCPSSRMCRGWSCSNIRAVSSQGS